MLVRVNDKESRIKFWNKCTLTATVTIIILGVMSGLLAFTIKPHEEFGRIDRRNVISQIQTDWRQIPFVSIDSYEDGCPEDMDPVFERVWKGIEPGCMIDYEYTKKEGKSTNTYRSTTVVTDYEMANFERGEILGGCIERIREIAPVSQTYFGGKTICGKRGGMPFAEVQRPIMTNG